MSCRSGRGHRRTGECKRRGRSGERHHVRRDGWRRQFPSEHQLAGNHQQRRRLDAPLFGARRPELVAADGPLGLRQHRDDVLDRRRSDAGLARDGERVVGMARLLSDGVCNAYLVDVWTASSHRRRGIATAMIRHLLDEVPGQHVGLQTSSAQALYAALGFRKQPEFWGMTVGGWLDNDANR